MKVVFMGTPEFSVAALKALINNHDVKAVISQPDKPKGRGKKLVPTPVKQTALDNNIPVFQPEKIKDAEFIEKLKNIDADIFVVAAYGQILPESILNMPKYGCINIHASLLPKYRGAAPIQRCIIEGEKITGITIMYMEKGLDTGDMIIKKEVEIEDTDTYGTLHDKMADSGAELIIEALKLIESGQAKPQKQNDDLSTYAHMIKKETGHIDWNKTSVEILNLIRGLNPAPCAYTYYNNDVFKIWSAEIFDTDIQAAEGEIIIADSKKGIAVKTADSAVLIKEIQAKGGKKMFSADYLRGHSIDIGVILNWLKFIENLLILNILFYVLC